MINRAVSSRSWLVLSLIACFLAAIGGVLVGRILFPEPAAPGAELHDVLHHKLSLDPGQTARIELLEQQYGIRRRALELELKADNVQLAEAMEAEHGNGPRVTAAVDRSHGVLGELQKATLNHIFAMRQLLRPDQTAAFDRAVVKALTDDTH
jgi:hypothetical protein